MADNPPIKIYLNKIENKIKFKIKTGYYLELVTPERMTLLRTIKNKTKKNENAYNVPRFEIAEVVSVHCIVANNDYQHDSRFLCTFVLNKLFGQLLNISPKSFIFLKTFNSEFSYLEVRFTNQSSKALSIENKIFIYLFIHLLIYLFTYWRRFIQDKNTATIQTL